MLLAGDAEAREVEYIADDPYTRPQTVVNVPKLLTLCSKVPRPSDRGSFRRAARAELMK
jgi:hypothetical protein